MLGRRILRLNDAAADHAKSTRWLPSAARQRQRRLNMSLATATLSDSVGGSALPLDEDGFLIDTRQWNRTLAQQLADHAGIGQLDATQWSMIEFIRDKYFSVGAMPPMRSLCHKLGVDRTAVKQAFGDCRDLCRIAGLPNPGPEALSYMA
jgi:tRNA 2-thiouridine synthesizing protein E